MHKTILTLLGSALLAATAVQTASAAERRALHDIKRPQISAFGRQCRQVIAKSALWRAPKPAQIRCDQAGPRARGKSTNGSCFSALRLIARCAASG